MISEEKDAMERALRAPLSVKEELALRRIVLGGLEPGGVRAPDARRLIELSLVEKCEGGFRPTEVGMQRYRKLANAPENKSWTEKR